MRDSNLISVASHGLVQRSAHSMEIGIRQTALQQALGSQGRGRGADDRAADLRGRRLLLDEHYQDLLGDGHWLVDKNGRFLTQPAADDDRILFDSRVAIPGLKYKFLQAKGLEFGEQMRDFIIRLNKLAVRANNRVLDLDVDTGRKSDGKNSPERTGRKGSMSASRQRGIAMAATPCR